MSNYLNHLINRNLDRTNQVKPRLPSLFEPLPETAGLRTAFTGERDLVMTPVSETTAWEASRLQPPRTQERRSSAPPSAGSPAVASLESHTSSTDQDSSRSMPPLKLPTLSNENLPAISSPTSRAEEQSELSSKTLALSPRLSASPAQTIALPGVIEDWGESIVPSSQVATPSVRQTEITTKRLEQTDSPVAPAIHSATASPSPASVQEPPVIRPISVIAPVAERIAPRAQFLEGQTIAPSQSVPPMTTIHVTIGRIEVRATPPASVQPRARPASPVMNLDDYLRQRGGGK